MSTGHDPKRLCRGVVGGLARRAIRVATRGARRRVCDASELYAGFQRGTDSPLDTARDKAHATEDNTRYWGESAVVY